MPLLQNLPFQTAWQSRLSATARCRCSGNNELITISKYWKEWSDPRLIVLVLNNSDLNQVTWEQRALSGNPKYEASQDMPDFPFARYAELLGLRGIRVDKTERRRASLGPGTVGRPSGGIRSLHRSERSDTCHRIFHSRWRLPMHLPY